MSLNGILSTSLSGLFTNQSALNATSNNIANVNTEGYNRLEVSQSATILQGQVAGVEIAEIRRVVDEFLEVGVRNAVGNTEEFAVQRRFHDRLQGFLGSPDSESSLSARVNELFSSISSLTLAPNDILRRQAVLAELSAVLNQINNIETQLQLLRADASEQLVQSSQQVNEALSRIFELNPLLVRENSLERESGGLENQLAAALEDLASEIDIVVQQNGNGSVAVFTAAGQPLVDIAVLTRVSYAAPGIVTASTIFPPVEATPIDPDTGLEISPPIDLSAQVRSGEMRGLLDLRDTALVDLGTSLGELAARLQDQLNAIHNQFAAVPPRAEMQGRQTILDGANDLNFSGTTSFVVTNPDLSLNTQVDVDFDAQTINGVANVAAFASVGSFVTAVNTALGGAASFTFTDGVLNFAATNTAGGVLIAEDAANIPSSRAGRGFSHYFGMNDLVVADGTGIFEPGISGTDTHGIINGSTLSFSVRDANNRELAVSTITVATATNTTYDDMITALNDTSTGMGNFFTFSLNATTGAIEYTINPPREGLSFKLVSDTTQLHNSEISFGAAFGLDESFRVPPAQNAQISDFVQDNPTLLASAAYEFTAPAGAAVLSAGDQSGVLALQNLETSLVSFEAAGELVAGDVTFSQYVSRFLGNAGVIAERVTNLEEDNRALQFELQQRQSDFSGVNLDEELANLVIFQNAYSAAARILSSVQELYDSLLESV